MVLQRDSVVLSAFESGVLSLSFGVLVVPRNSEKNLINA